MRRCKRCDNIYKTTCKFGKICDECRCPTGYEARREIINEKYIL